MVKRSLQASPDGIQRAKRAFALKGWTQENLAGEVRSTRRSPDFFSGLFHSRFRLARHCRKSAC
jgi:hypothetical protein